MKISSLSAAFLAFSIVSNLSCMAAEEHVTDGSASVNASINIPLTCSIDPVTIDFGDLDNLSSAESKQYVTEEVVFSCENIPANEAVILKQSLASLTGVTRDIDGYDSGNLSVNINGTPFTYQLGIKPKHTPGGDASRLYRKYYTSFQSKQTFSITTDFLLNFPDIEQMNAAIAASGNSSKAISITLPLEIKTESI